MSKEFLFIQDLGVLAPEGYAFGDDKDADQKLAQDVFELRGVDISGLTLYTFDLYSPKSGGPVLAFLAGRNIDKSDRGGYLEYNLRELTETVAKKTLREDPAHTIIRVYNILATLGATHAAEIRHTDLEHLLSCLENEQWEDYRYVSIDGQLANYGRVLDVTGIKMPVVV